MLSIDYFAVIITFCLDSTIGCYYNGSDKLYSHSKNNKGQHENDYKSL